MRSININKPRENINVYDLAERLSSQLNTEPKQYPGELQKVALSIMNLTATEQVIAIDQISKTTKTTKSEIKEVIKAIKSEQINNTFGLNEIDKLELFISENFKIHYNVISNRFYFEDLETGQDDVDEYAILRKMRKNNIKASINTIVEIIKSPFTPRFNPFQDYFESLDKWDKSDHISKLCNFINTTDQGRFVVQFKKHLVRTVAGALEREFNKQAFIFVGSEGENNQNSGKTTLVRWLCPPALADYYAEDLIGDKDTLTTLSSSFIINLDELANFGKKELAELKAIMSKDKINVRLPYDKRSSILPRRASFFGSTNEATFLNDLTGNVRWIAFKLSPTNPINWEYSKKMHPDQIWSQAYHLFKEGYSAKLTKDEIRANEQANEQFLNLPAEYEMIQEYFIPGTSKDFDSFSGTVQIMEFLLSNSQKTRLIEKILGQSLRQLGFHRQQINRKWGYYLKYAKTDPFIYSNLKNHEIL
jgi:predicted P-loop ATPase